MKFERMPGSLRGVLTAAGIVLGTEACDREERADPPVQIAPMHHEVVREHRYIPESAIGEFIADKRIVVVGDEHSTGKEDALLVRSLPVFKRSGFTHIGLEIDGRSQGVIDEYIRSGAEEPLRSAFAGYMNAEEIVDVMTTARAQGMGILCVDDRHFAGGDGMEKRAWWSTRDERIFNNIQRAIDADPDTRLIVFIGNGHLETGDMSVFQNGSQADGMPNLITIDKPLGSRLVGKYGSSVGILDVASETDKTGFIVLH